MIGSLQALEALKFLTGAQPPLRRRVPVTSTSPRCETTARQREPAAGLPGLRRRSLRADAGSEHDPPRLRRAAPRRRRPCASATPRPTGVSTFEILTGWPGLHALLAHRVAHALDAAGVPVAPRALAYFSRALTGIEIHPAARIGDGLFIDHGMGVVIGETAEVGANVTMYQGVTLGGTGFETGKRHPTVQDNVTIGSGAKLLGPITIGHGAKIGANTVVIHEVPPNSTVVGNPGHPVRVEGRKPEGPDADWVHLPDPIADALKQMATRIAVLEREVAMLRGEDAGRARRGRAAAARAWPEPRGRVAWGLVPSFSHSVDSPSRPTRSSRGCWRRTRSRSGRATSSATRVGAARASARTRCQTLTWPAGSSSTWRSRATTRRAARRRASRPTA